MPSPSEEFDILVKDIYPGIAPEKFAGAHNDKVVFITGAGTGLGLCAAKAFSRCGAKVYLTGRRPEPLEAAKAEIVASGGEADFTQMDVTDPKSVSAGVRAAVERFGKIDIVIANASRIPHPGQRIADFDVEDWWSCVETNLKGCFLTAHSTLPHLIVSKGYIILVSSRAAQRHAPGWSSYGTCKHAVNRLAEWIDIEYRDQGVKSFAVHPGAVASTAMSQRFVAYDPTAVSWMDQSAELSAWTYVRLTSGSEDWLSGRYVQCTASLDELDKLKEKILEQDALKNRLLLPV